MIQFLMSMFRTFKKKYDGDEVDRACYYITSNMLIVLSCLSAYKTFSGSPIECMTPVSFPSSWITAKMMIESFVGFMKYLSPREDDDYSDRLNYLYTPNILLAFSVLISFKQFGSKPLECMFPTKFPGSWEQYAENYCFGQDTYFVQPDEHVANINEADRYSPERRLSYYQWVPFFLLFQAACFRFPSIFWKYISVHSGIRVHEIVERAMDPGNLENSVKSKNIDILASHISAALKFQRKVARRNIIVHKIMKFFNIAYSACFISYMYLIMKALYLANVVIQFYFMNKFLETDRYQWYGIGVIRDIISGTEWEKSGYFPRTSICDFQVRQVANIQKYSVQCVLVINMFNEKIFIILYFWYVAIMFATLFSFAYWALIMSFSCFGRWFITSNLELGETEGFCPEKQHKQVKRFVNDYLKQDGIFVLRMISTHAGIIFGTELVAKLYDVFTTIEDKASFCAFVPEMTVNDEKGMGAVRRRNVHKSVDDLSINLEEPLLKGHHGDDQSPESGRDSSRHSEKKSSRNSKGLSMNADSESSQRTESTRPLE
uniref:Innexin n=1 Tax=Rhabditophanes sp. KR3021 TaxID=114890 RepID=A0AC35U886_9BILA